MLKPSNEGPTGSRCKAASGLGFGQVGASLQPLPLRCSHLRTSAKHCRSTEGASSSRPRQQGPDLLGCTPLWPLNNPNYNAEDHYLSMSCLNASWRLQTSPASAGVRHPKPRAPVRVAEALTRAGGSGPRVQSSPHGPARTPAQPPAQRRRPAAAAPAAPLQGERGRTALGALCSEGFIACSPAGA